MTSNKANTIQLENVYYMLAYAFKAINLDAYKHVGAEAFDGAENLLGAILHQVMRPHLKGGLYRTYEDVTSDLSTIRGRLCVRETFDRFVRKSKSLVCQYDEFTTNNLFNRILKLAISILIRSGRLSQSIKKSLMGDYIHFSEVADISARSISWGSLRYQRTNVSYRVLMNFSRLIIDGELMGDKDKSGRMKLKLFTAEKLHDVYEAFLREYYRAHHPDVDVIGKKQLRWDVPVSDQAKMPRMETDVMIRKNNTFLIIDAKYYGSILGHRFGGASYNSNNLYQITTYVNSVVNDPAYVGCVVKGLLLYAKTDEHVVPLRTTIGGNDTGIDVLDLNQKFPVIVKQLDAIIKEMLP